MFPKFRFPIKGLAVMIVVFLTAAACSPPDVCVDGPPPTTEGAGATGDADESSANESEPDTESVTDQTGRITDGLVTLYNFEEGSGDQVTDSAGGHDLTIADPDAVEWLDGALNINTATVITSPEPPVAMIDGASTSGELTVEAWIETNDLEQSGPARIVSISGDRQNRNFTVGQGVHGSTGNFLDVRLRSTDTDDNGTPSLASPDGVLTTALTHIVATRSSDGTTRLYFDGALESTGSAGGDLSNWDDSYRLLLGNETSNDRPWIGTLHLVALYDRALSEADVAQNFDSGLTTQG